MRHSKSNLKYAENNVTRSSRKKKNDRPLIGNRSARTTTKQLTMLIDRNPPRLQWRSIKKTNKHGGMEEPFFEAFLWMQMIYHLVFINHCVFCLVIIIMYFNIL